MQRISWNKCEKVLGFPCGKDQAIQVLVCWRLNPHMEAFLLRLFIQKLSIYLQDVVENMTHCACDFLVVFLLLPEGEVLASALVFHKLSEVREVTCTVTVPWIPACCCQEQGMEECHVLGVFCRWHWSGRVCRAAIRQFPPCLCWWSQVQPLDVLEGRVSLMEFCSSHSGLLPEGEAFQSVRNDSWIVAV